MLEVVLIVLIFASLIYSIISKDASGISNAALSGSGDAVSLCIKLCGSMALWGGLMNVAEKCGITKKLSAVISKPLKLLFKGMNDPGTLSLISLNVTANLLGLGNAATPLGIKAMKRLYGSGKVNKRHAAIFVLLNTASIQLIPMTVSTMRMEHGAQNPWDCALPTVITSLMSLAAGITATLIFYPDRGGD